MDSNKFNVSEKLLQYEQWVNEVLKRDLQTTYEQRKKLQLELKEYEDLEANVLELQKNGAEPFKTLVNVGQEVHCQARVPDVQYIYINVGLGFHLQCTLDEAPRVIQPRKKALEVRIKRLTEGVCKLKATIKFVYEAMNELSIVGSD